MNKFKSLFALILVVALSLVSCEDKAKKEAENQQRIQDSLAQVAAAAASRVADSTAKVAAELAAKEKAVADSIAKKNTADSLAAVKKGKKWVAPKKKVVTTKTTTSTVKATTVTPTPTPTTTAPATKDVVKDPTGGKGTGNQNTGTKDPTGVKGTGTTATTGANKGTTSTPKPKDVTGAKGAH